MAETVAHPSSGTKKMAWERNNRLGPMILVQTIVFVLSLVGVVTLLKYMHNVDVGIAMSIGLCGAGFFSYAGAWLWVRFACHVVGRPDHFTVIDRKTVLCSGEVARQPWSRKIEYVKTEICTENGHHFVYDDDVMISAHVRGRRFLPKDKVLAYLGNEEMTASEISMREHNILTEALGHAIIHVGIEDGFKEVRPALPKAYPSQKEIDALCVEYLGRTGIRHDMEVTWGITAPPSLLLSAMVRYQDEQKRKL